jgi:hypothetical protein
MFNKGAILNRILRLEDLRPRNVIINSNFDIWQRGTSSGDAGYNTADRWFINVGANFVASRQLFTLGQTAVPNEPEFYLRVATPSGPGNIVINQKIENVRTFAGKTISGSFWAKASFSGASISVTIRQEFGNGGGTTTNVSGSRLTTTSWTKYVFSADIPSISEKVIAGINNNLTLFMQLDTPGVDTFDIAQFQLNEGKLQDYEPISVDNELEACKRYYHRINGGSNYGLGIGQAALTGRVDVVYVFPVEMRRTPSPLASEPWALKFNHSSLPPDSSAVSFSGSNVHSSIVRGTTSGLTQNDAVQVFIIAGEWIAFDAEI